MNGLFNGKRVSAEGFGLFHEVHIESLIAQVQSGSHTGNSAAEYQGVVADRHFALFQWSKQLGPSNGHPGQIHSLEVASSLCEACTQEHWSRMFRHGEQIRVQP